MTSPKNNFKGQLENEEVFFFFRRHWMKIIPGIYLIGFSLLLFFLALVFSESIFKSVNFSIHTIKWIFLLIFTVLMVVIHYEFMEIFHYHLHTVVLTNMRLVIVDKSIFFKDSRESIDLLKIQEVNKKQNGIFPTVLNYGTFIITLSGSEKPVKIESVPTPDYYFKQINKIKQDMIAAQSQGKLE